MPIFEDADLGFSGVCDAYSSYRYGDPVVTVLLSFTLPHYDYFNRNFTTPTGLKPYADITSKNYGISLTTTVEF